MKWNVNRDQTRFELTRKRGPRKADNWLKGDGLILYFREVSWLVGEAFGAPCSGLLQHLINEELVPPITLASGPCRPHCYLCLPRTILATEGVQPTIKATFPRSAPALRVVTHLSPCLVTASAALNLWTLFPQYTHMWPPGPLPSRLCTCPHLFLLGAHLYAISTVMMTAD